MIANIIRLITNSVLLTVCAVCLQFLSYTGPFKKIRVNFFKVVVVKVSTVSRLKLKVRSTCKLRILSLVPTTVKSIIIDLQRSHVAKFLGTKSIWL